MPSVSGNVGAVFNGGTISTPLAINAGDVTDLRLVAVASAGNNLVKMNVADADPTIWAYVTDTEADWVVGGTASGAPNATMYADPTGGQVAAKRPDSTEIRLNAFVGSNWLDVILGAATPVRIDPSGYVVVALNAAPADGALVAGEMALWFDQTNGAAKLMVKAKQADGTVRTGSLALA